MCKINVLISRSLIALSVALAFVTLSLHAEGPRVFLLDGRQLHLNRQRIADGDRRLQPAADALQREAKRALGAGPFSVVDKDFVPPSGDKHDYMSLAPYWWPNPETPDGLPYIQRDGERNPEIYKLRNRHDLGELAETLDTLSLAYYFTRDEQYATRATLLVRTWFLEPATRMNPNFEFAQAVRGVNTGRGQGMIESRLFTNVVDDVGMLAGSNAWTDKDQHGIEQWVTEFLQWMQNSAHGHDESHAKNNHGTYYDIQIASYALFLGKKELATEVLEAAKSKRIAAQIEPDGRQPFELVRTKAWGYSLANLSGLMSLARLGENVGVDLWHFKTADGRSIQAAIDFLLPFGLGSQKWPYKQIDGFSRAAIHPLLRRAAAKYPGSDYKSLLSKLPPIDPASRSNLLLAPLTPEP